MASPMSANKAELLAIANAVASEKMIDKSIVIARGGATVCDTTSLIGATPVTASVGSTSQTDSRTAEARASGSPALRTTRFTERRGSCSKGKYIAGRGSRSSPKCLVSATTPTTWRIVCPIRTRLWSGSSFGQ